jgi:diguanylate cyclase (GGDEF)-like protein
LFEWSNYGADVLLRKGAVAMTLDQLSPHLDASAPVAGVRNPRRLRAVAEAKLEGHLGDQGLDAVVATLHVACNVPIAVINIVTADMQTYPAEVGVGAPCTTFVDELSFCASVVERGVSLTIRDASTHPVFSRNSSVMAGAIGAYAGEPLLDNGFVVGAVSIFDNKVREFTTAELDILHHQALLASTVLALRRSARTDVLTGLPNRGLFVDRLTHALDKLRRHSDLVSAMFLDVDNFKGINDRYGHEVGDAVLVELSNRLRSAIRVTDTLARLGGDEFVALCEDLHHPDDAALVAEHMIAAVDKAWVIAGQLIPVSISIGIAVADSPDVEPALLLRDADASMYLAKKQPGSAFVLSTSLVA